jgi:hypothetical protein
MPNPVINRRVLVVNSGLDPVVKNYINVVLPAIAAPALSKVSVVALNKFVKGLRSDNVWPKMREVNCFPYAGVGSFAIATAPLLLGPSGANSGLYQWSNRAGAFLDSDFTIDGVAGNGTTKGFVTGIQPTLTFSSANSAGLTVYTSTNTTTGYDAGAFNLAGTALFGIGSDSGNTFNSDCWDPAVNSSLTPASPGLAGFYSMSRISATDFRNYFANSTNAFAQKAVNATPSAQTWFGGAANDDLIVCGVQFNGTMVAPTARRISFFAAHEGLTATETQLLFNRVQTLRMSLGGGFV